MKLLVIGGTHFVGRWAVEEAAARGHEVTVFHRGPNEPKGLAVVEHVHGDRNGGLGALSGRTWDATLDTCGYVPREIREVEAVLGDAAGRYTFVSSISVYPDDVLPGADDDTPTYQPPFPDTEEITAESYGPLKVACEREALEGFAGRCLIIRPGYVVGPHDPTDRFTSWVRRAGEGGEMLGPSPASEILQVIDVRDLAVFMLERIEAAAGGVFGVVSPEAVTWGSALEAMCRAGGAGTRVEWVDAAFLNETLGDDRWTVLPMWNVEEPGLPGFDPSAAVAAGLPHRPFSDTVADTLAWDRTRPPGPLKAGLTADRERELLDAWHARSR